VAEPLPPLLTLPAPPALINTGRPEEALADTTKLVPYTALPGGAWVTVIV
jgi:hypothetical protein